jgi:hypothetical protein
MTDNAPLTFTGIWKEFDDQRRLQAGTAFWSDPSFAASYPDVYSMLERRLKTRRKTLAKMPVERRAHYLITTPALAEPMAGVLVRAYMFVQQKPMLIDFLNSLEIKHTDGAFDESSLPEPPSAERIALALEQLKQKYDPAQVALYVKALKAEDPVLWANMPRE